MTAPLPGYRPSRHLAQPICSMDAAIDRYFAVEAEIIADLERRHEAHKAQLAATSERIERFLGEVQP